MVFVIWFRTWKALNTIFHKNLFWSLNSETFMILNLNFKFSILRDKLTVQLWKVLNLLKLPIIRLNLSFNPNLNRNWISIVPLSTICPFIGHRIVCIVHRTIKVQKLFRRTIKAKSIKAKQEIYDNNTLHYHPVKASLKSDSKIITRHEWVTHQW